MLKMDQRDHMVHPAPQDSMVHPAPQDRMVNLVLRDHTVHQVLQDHMAHQVLQDRMVNLDHMLHLVPRDHMVHLAPKDHMVHLAPQDHMVHLAHKDHMAHLVHQMALDLINTHHLDRDIHKVLVILATLMDQVCNMETIHSHEVHGIKDIMDQVVMALMGPLKLATLLLRVLHVNLMLIQPLTTLIRQMKIPTPTLRDPQAE